MCIRDSLGAAAQIPDGVHEEHGLVAVGIGELLGHLAKGVDFNGGLGVAEADVLHGDGQQPPPHFLVEDVYKRQEKVRRVQSASSLAVWE